MTTKASEFGDFDAEKYVQTYFQSPEKTDGKIGLAEFLMKHLARFYTGTMSGVAPNSLKVLDYGCGPSIAYSISAAPKASEIILADYSSGNREYIQKWLDKDPTLCDHWSPYFKHVVQTLEGGSEEEAVQRQNMLREKIKAVLPCDLREEVFIPDAYGNKGSYDIIMSFLCLENCCDDLASYERGFEKLASLVKKGGYLLLCSTRREGAEEGFYIVGGTRYNNISLKKDFILKNFRVNGLRIIEEDYLPKPDTVSGNTDGFLFFAAFKS